MAANFTLKEKLVDRMTGSALTAWYNAVEDAISRIDEDLVVGNVTIFIYDASSLEKNNKKVTYENEEGDEGPETNVNYYTRLPYFSDSYANEDVESKYKLLLKTLADLVKREGLDLCECEDGFMVS